MSEQFKKPMDQKIRKKIADKMQKMCSEGDKIFLATWDDRRIAWECTMLSSYYFDNYAKFDEIINAACEGTGYYIELENSCEGRLYEA